MREINIKIIDLNKIVHIAYILFLIGIITGGVMCISTMISLTIIYIKRSESYGSFYLSHFDWILRTFWWGLLWSSLGILFINIFIGYIILLLNIIWITYRITRGWVGLIEYKEPVYFF